MAEKDEESQTVELPSRRKMLPKRSKAQHPAPPGHHPFISAKAKRSFTETIQGKHPFKERAMDLDNFGTDKEIQEII